LSFGLARQGSAAKLALPRQHIVPLNEVRVKEDAEMEIFTSALTQTILCIIGSTRVAY